MLRGVWWNRLRRALDRNVVFVPVLILVILILVGGFSRLLTVRQRVVVPQTPSTVTPIPTPRTPQPLTGPPPNIVFILTDDQRVSDMSEMPNVRRLFADRGMTFTNAFASTPLCCPSRASILTGRHPYHTGVLDNEPPGGGLEAFDERSTLATWLQEAGYTTSYIGKYLNGYEQLRDKSYVPPGWDDWHVAVGLEQGLGPTSGYYDYGMNENGEFRTFGNDPEDYVTNVIQQRALDFISKASPPFFLHFATSAPHIPARPGPGDEDAFADRPPERPPSYDVKAADNSPAGSFDPITPGLRFIVDRYVRQIFASLLSVDRAVAAIHDAVEKRGLLDNTVFIYMSDNGMLVGEHRIFGKAWPYEPSVKIPLIIRLPDSTTASVSNELVENVDIAPTITELAGARARLRPDGMSLVPLLRGEDVRWRQEIPLMYIGDGALFAPPKYIAIRTTRYKLVLYENGMRELFDLQEDPHELTNLSGRPEAFEIEEPLYQRLEKLTVSGHLGRRHLPRPTPYPSVPPEEFFRD